MRHVITNVVGGPEAGVKVEARALQIEPGDRVLLCSDGLTEAVTDEVIAATLDREADVEAAAKHLMAEALAGPAKDNITLVVASFDSPA
jgi:serine/threonine protein phosphatase PrpC